MDLVEFFLAEHAAVHRTHVFDVSDAAMRIRPAPGLNSLLWLAWHVARTEDVAVNLVVAARPQVFDTDWAERMKIRRRDVGTGMTADEVAELTEQADVAAVRAYRTAVANRTREVVKTLAPAAWDEIVGLGDTTRAAHAGAFGPNDEWVEGVGLPGWQGHSRGAQLGNSAIRHNAVHLGEAITIIGLAGFGI
jgi:hypothetical protein